LIQWKSYGLFKFAFEKDGSRYTTTEIIAAPQYSKSTNKKRSQNLLKLANVKFFTHLV